MTRILPIVALLALSAAPLAAEPLPPGLHSAQLLPGWSEDGKRIAALELVLEPGWKTYWRSPGDSGLPPEFDWSGSTNLAGVSFHWPRPEPIDSGGEITLGYHDRLILPFTAHALQPDKPVDLAANVDLGLCERICVPARLELRADAAQAQPDPHIMAAMAQAPQQSDRQPACSLGPVDDGMRVVMRLPHDAPLAAATELAAIELEGRPDIWVSDVDIDRHGQELRLAADLVPPDGQPFDVPRQQLRLTLIGADNAVEMQGCDPAG